MPRKFYVRFGKFRRRSEIGPLKQSLNRLYGGHSNTHEKGVSVYDATWNPALLKWEIPPLAHFANTFQELLDAAENGAPIYLVTGRAAREPYLDTWTGKWRTGNALGSDDEPLLRDVKIVCMLTVADVWYAPVMAGFEFAAPSRGCDRKAASGKARRRR